MKQQTNLYFNVRLYLLIVAVSIVCFMLEACNVSFIITPMDYGATGSDTSLLVFSQGSSLGYMSGDGKVMIQPQFADAHPFYEGLAAVKRNGKYGYIDQSGKTIIPFQYSVASEFHHGKAIVGIGSDDTMKSCVIDVNGNAVQELEYTDFVAYSNEYCVIRKEKEDVYAVLDDNYTEVGAVSSDVWSEFRNYVNQFHVQRELTVEKTTQYLSLSRAFKNFFSEGLAACRLPPDNRYGYIDANDTTVIQPQYDEAYPFGEGLACVSDGRYRIIDRTGKEKCQIRYVDGMIEFGSFSDGLCIVHISKNLKHRYGYIDASGQMVIQANFDEVTPFKNGIAEVKVDGKVGYIDKTGKYIWGPK